jgi:hypothetical protein
VTDVDWGVLSNDSVSLSSQMAGLCAEGRIASRNLTSASWARKHSVYENGIAYV